MARKPSACREAGYAGARSWPYRSDPDGSPPGLSRPAGPARAGGQLGPDHYGVRAPDPADAHLVGFVSLIPAEPLCCAEVTLRGRGCSRETDCLHLRTHLTRGEGT